MKLTFEIAAFVEAAKALRQIPSTSIRLDILNHARLHAAVGSLSLTMSDMDMEGHATIACEVDGEILAAVPRAVLDFLVAREGTAPETATLDFTEDMQRVVCRHGAARITMPLMPADQFPVLADAAPDWSFPVRAHILCRALRRCEKAVSTNESQITALGAFLHAGPDGLAVIGSDVNRMHVLDIDAGGLAGALPQPTGAPAPGVMIPARTLREIQRMFSGDESEVTVSGTDALVSVRGSALRITSKLYDAVYFDYRRIPMPRDDAFVTLPTDRLSRALDGLLTVPKTEAKGKRVSGAITMVVREGAIELTTRGDTGDGEDRIEVAVEGLEGGETISFHPPYLRDALDALDAKTVSIHMPEKIGMPFRLRGADGDGTFVIGQRRP